MKLLREVLDPDQVGFLKYKPFVMRLDGVPMIQFISPELKKLAMLVVERDASAEDFSREIDPRKVESMKVEDFKRAIDGLRTDDFSMTSQQIQTLFLNQTKQSTTSLKTLSISKLVKDVFYAV